jgi:hypothetical protein
MGWSSGQADSSTQTCAVAQSEQALKTRRHLATSLIMIIPDKPAQVVRQQSTIADAR